MSQGKTIIYKERAKLNLKVFQFLYFFGIAKYEFVVLIMQTPMEIDEAFNFDDLITFSERVKKSTQDTVDKMEQKINDKTDSLGKNIQEIFEKLNKKIETKTQNIEKLNVKMDKILKKLED